MSSDGWSASETVLCGVNTGEPASGPDGQHEEEADEAEVLRGLPAKRLPVDWSELPLRPKGISGREPGIDMQGIGDRRMNSTTKDVNSFLPGREDAVKALAAALETRKVPAELVSTNALWPQRTWVYGVRVDGTAVVRAKYHNGVWRYRLQPPDLAPSDDLPPSARDFGDARDPATAADAVQAWLTELDERPVYLAIDEPPADEPPASGQA